MIDVQSITCIQWSTWWIVQLCIKSSFFLQIYNIKICHSGGNFCLDCSEINIFPGLLITNVHSVSIYTNVQIFTHTYALPQNENIFKTLSSNVTQWQDWNLLERTTFQQNKILLTFTRIIFAFQLFVQKTKQKQKQIMPFHKTMF